MAKRRTVTFRTPTLIFSIIGILLLLLPNLPSTTAAMDHHAYHEDQDKWSSTHHLHHKTMKPHKDRVKEAAEGVLE